MVAFSRVLTAGRSSGIEGRGYRQGDQPQNRRHSSRPACSRQVRQASVCWCFGNWAVSSEDFDFSFFRFCFCFHEYVDRNCVFVFLLVLVGLVLVVVSLVFLLLCVVSLLFFSRTVEFVHAVARSLIFGGGLTPATFFLRRD